MRGKDVYCEGLIVPSLKTDFETPPPTPSLWEGVFVVHIGLGGGAG
ncbi:hypothetical protein MICA_2154 [Micavibrio aeruginosavorus ARL-13]|uniref:Uncharacterized protein n=1 Tax=Micavibrio aeruginosavorus (strain ARL-13) TaxID=856793 RepID=G2KQY3_MICAA|nr:hypothetical protein MICA_2154 [Micavibrio aeruginosavorus ARL-13]